MDSALSAAASMVNEGIGPQTIHVSPAAYAAIAAIDPESLVAALPGGMPDRLEQQALLVYSDLVSRRYAYQSLFLLRGNPPVSRTSSDGRLALRGLADGAEAAARFPTDLATLRSSASALGPFVPAAPASHATAAIAVRANYITGANRGCGASGGWRATAPIPIVWQQGTDSTGQRTDGTVAAVTFRADYQPGRGWSVLIYAC